MRNHTIPTPSRLALLLGLALCCTAGGARAQADTGGSATTADHRKQVIGYITEWDAWKDAKAGLPAKAALNQLAIDYSKYTMLNYSFFGVAEDGSLHGGDSRNRAGLWKPDVVQGPASLFEPDATWSSYDLWLMYGELELVPKLNDDVLRRATAQGFTDVRMVGGEIVWSRPEWQVKDAKTPLPLKKVGGAPGLLELAHNRGVKVMASIGGWSMSKHISDAVADPEKRARLVAGCVKLINLGFDGIDLDWEYPGPFSGMNFTGKEVDYDNFLTLVTEIRAALPRGKLITAAMSADPKKLRNFDWASLDGVMDYFNFMSYDYNGGWSDKAGHNSPLANYDGADYAAFNWTSLLASLKAMKVNLHKVSLGMPFYGRGVVTNGDAKLGAPTLKKAVTLNPDGPSQTASDFTNWKTDVYDGTPNYEFIRQALAKDSGWVVKRDPQARVPYATKGKFFLSYDDAESIGEKARFIKENDLAGTIVWHAFGDLQFGGVGTDFGKINRWSEMKSPLVNRINEVFASPVNLLPTVNIVAPSDNAQVRPGDGVQLSVEAADADGKVVKVEYFDGARKLGESSAAPFGWSATQLTEGVHEFTARATDDANGSTLSPPLHVVASNSHAPLVEITAPRDQANFRARNDVAISLQTSDDGAVKKVAFYEGARLLGEVGAPPFAFTWMSVPAGTFALKAVATDDSGLITASAPVTIVVAPNNNKPPVIAVSAPANNALYHVGESVVFAANASDPEGQLGKVEFFQDGVSVGVKTAPPYTVTLANLSKGPHSLVAVATDADTQYARASVGVMVNPAGVNAWGVSVSYTAGTLVSYNQQYWRCLVNHRAQADWAPGAVNLWEQVPLSKL